MVNKIKFDCNYPKLCNQAHAKLVWIDEIRDCDFVLKWTALKALFDYDTKRPDGTQKNITRGGGLFAAAFCWRQGHNVFNFKA